MGSNTISLDIGGSHIDLAIINDDFKPQIIQSLKVDSNLKFREFIDWLIDSLKEKGLKNVGKMGFSLPGTVDPYNNYCFICPNLKEWKNLDFNELYEVFNKEGIRVDKILISNDANAGAVGAYKIQKLNKKNIVYIAIGTGIGAGAIINERLLLGANFSAMELGHTKIEENSYICGCGARGCIETFASTKALVKKFNKLYKSNYDNLLEIILHEKPSRLKRIFRIFAQYLSILINNVVYFIDPDFIFVSGKIVISSHLFKDFLFENILSKITMIKNYDLGKIIFLGDVEKGNIYNLVGSVYIDEFI